jgi:hypothetical protein
MKISEKTVNCIKKTYSRVKFGVKCGEGKMKGFEGQRSDIKQGCRLTAHLFNIYTDGSAGYISEGNFRAPITGRKTIQGLLFADDLAISSFTITGLEKAINQAVKYCKDWNLKCNLKKSKTLVFTKGRMLKKKERWIMKD